MNSIIGAEQTEILLVTKWGISEKLKTWKISHQDTKVSLTIFKNIYNYLSMQVLYQTITPQKNCQPLLRSIKGKNPKAPGPLRDWIHFSVWMKWCSDAAQRTSNSSFNVHSYNKHNANKIHCFLLKLIFSVTKTGSCHFLLRPKITPPWHRVVACLDLFRKAPGIQGCRCSRTLPGAIAHAVIPMAHTCSSLRLLSSAKKKTSLRVSSTSCILYTHVPKCLSRVRGLHFENKVDSTST